MKKYQIVCKHKHIDEWEVPSGSLLYFVVDKDTGWRTQQEFSSAAEAHDFIVRKLLIKPRKKK